MGILLFSNIYSLNPLSNGFLALKWHVCLSILVATVRITSENMARSLSSLFDWAPQFFDQGSGFQIRQGLVNAFQNESSFNTLIIVTFIVAYGIALQIAISMAFRKYPLYKLLTEFIALKIINICCNEFAFIY